MKTKHRATVINWVDSTSWLGWRSIGSDLCPSEITTIGWLISKSKSHVVVTSCISGDDQGRDAVTIPRGCITKMETLDRYVEGER